MVEMCDLSGIERQRMVRDVSTTMEYIYKLNQESINEFWQTVEIGLQARKAI